MTTARGRVAVLAAVLLTLQLSASQLLDAQDFEPQVTASCDASTMTILVRTQKPFFGVIHGKDIRTDPCTQFGEGGLETRMRVNLLAGEGDEDYCGVRGNNRTDDRSIPIAVRFHKKLEVAEDKLYVITCGNPGFKNSRGDKSLVTLRLMDRGRRAKEVVYGRPYNLQVKISKPDESYDVGVKNCFSFSTEESRVDLINEQGCPERQGVITKFAYNKTTGTADATIASMYRFPDTNQVNFQCDVVICKGECPATVCRGDDPSTIKPSALVDADENANAHLMASTSVFVVEPGETVSLEPLTDCDGYHPEWLLYLCIAFGLLFLIMMIINCFLCTAMTCSCTKTEVVEKDPSLEDYDPYRSWHGSQYSLNGKSNHGYDNYGASTMNSARSVSTTNSDHYAMVHSRPGSRYSEPRSHRSVPRPPRSETGSQYRDQRGYNTTPRY
ncbi:uncharacterized protein LOC122369041 [Amphibalanus amphitrite]|uniref:uncharacterized protein LOC122369041 n=1 Tax=Amphibalanus amphitrite TaxID=1232801 RepID=UPI001C923F46|nr:uncharacterized protein LOC122369041 [Amphibalanus amphitrite]